MKEVPKTRSDKLSSSLAFLTSGLMVHALNTNSARMISKLDLVLNDSLTLSKFSGFGEEGEEEEEEAGGMLVESDLANALGSGAR